jgi:hypothetical protein
LEFTTPNFSRFSDGTVGFRETLNDNSPGFFGKGMVNAGQFKKGRVLCFLAFIKSRHISVGERFNVSNSTLFLAFEQVTAALLHISNDVIRWPRESEMGEIERGFEVMFGIKKILG